MVEVHYRIGLIESKKYAILLGYNYQSGEWYRNSYKVFNKNYQKLTKKKKDKNNQSIVKELHQYSKKMMNNDDIKKKYNAKIKNKIT